MVERSQLTASKHIQQRTGRTFHLATRVLPRRVRHPTYVLYAFFRIADEIVDGDEYTDPAAQREAIERLRDQVLGDAHADDPVVAAFAELCETHDIPRAEVSVFLDAMASDADPENARMETYADLEDYMRGSAVAVGNMMMAVMDTDDVETARPHARALGEAFQLTNFLRDVKEDVRDHGRIYVPLETLDAFGATPAQIERHESSAAFERAIRAELRRTEALYREGVAGIKYLPEDCQLAVLLSAVLYAEYHRAIRDQGGDVLTTEPSVSLPRKLWAVVRTRLAWAVHTDPETVFERVGAIPRHDATRGDVGAGDPTLLP